MPRGKHPKSRANLKPIKPGEVRNPKGRPTAGASVREWWNAMAAEGLSVAGLRKVAADPKTPWPKRSAAIQMLQSVEYPDMADLEPLLDGKVTLEELRASGFDTGIIRKIRVKRRTLYGEGGPVGEEVTREVELHDRAGHALDRIADRTDGRPRQQVDVTSGDEPLLRTPEDGVAEATAILAELQLMFGVQPAEPET